MKEWLIHSVPMDGISTRSLCQCEESTGGELDQFALQFGSRLRQMSFSRAHRNLTPPPTKAAKKSPKKKQRVSTAPSYPYQIAPVSPKYGSYLEYLETEFNA